uniref:Apple domain-containing protein n=1 Tax=Globodera pallida TaxID=36090 RepID=A0A183BW38_GLOPA
MASCLFDLVEVKNSYSFSIAGTELSGAEPHYDLGKEHDVSREQLPKECTDASGCKASVALARFQRRGCHFYDALVFEVDLFAFREAYQKCTWRAYIDEDSLLLDKDATNGYWTWTIAVAKLL